MHIVSSRHTQDDNPLTAYQKGHLRFELDAKKLKGRWDLIRFKNETQWFLVKYQDDFAKPVAAYDICEALPNSVVSGQTTEEIAKNYEKIWTREGAKKVPHKKTIKIPDFLEKSDFPTILLRRRN